MKKIFKKMFKSNLDEMQEQKLLKIEHNACWIAFWGLFISIVVQELMMRKPENTFGEQIVFLIMAGYMLIDCMRNNIWDRRLKPNLKTNIILSIIGGGVMGIAFLIRYLMVFKDVTNSILIGGFTFLFISLTIFIVLSVTAAIYKKKVKALEKSMDEKDI